MKKGYIDIGHGDRNSILWLYKDGQVEAVKAGDDNHEKLWGISAMNYWRGRFNEKKNEISVVAPILYKGSIVPQWILDKLEERFGSGLSTWQFNPMKEGRKIR